MAGTAQHRAETAEAEKLLADASGEWVDGQRVLGAIRRNVSPGRAVQLGWNYRKSHRTDGVRNLEDATLSPAEVERLRQAGLALRAEKATQTRLLCRKWESDTHPLRAAHFTGKKPFRLRAVQVDQRVSLAELCRILDVGRHTIVAWFGSGEAPQPERDNFDRPRFTPEMVAIYKQLRELYTGPTAPRWKSEPREVWKYPATCPHCGEPLR